ncbi:DUF4123 domain-containing protein [Pasteurella atlantica]|uniref:DUF4123 domain-containing protein n=1 Tax=Pasteurellaceae TaxID=712 RepID=UPI002752FDC2|nr:DUF4123 domain-containing protein [Pasteurella atlantica]MDP8033324.1 DUF4123 domain-containing protein [Pasteurella atlantica]MDP8035127.1 DUF4123 domain-containing protein [Pasteurella atlantica]MDP8037076.1 DUF4123 domain-containing protein [Pasteurella atlantica]MDP8047263.1 DUF4123 domain-containing protein [Pasteurella atlantica]MDP8049512.1 DUF4123 domain-containing protein [Pasteurella atlantica]
MNTLTNTPEIWIGHYCLSTNQQGFALGYAINREEFNARVKEYCSSLKVNETHKLAPLPLRIWIQRYSIDENITQFVKNLSIDNPFIFVYQEELSAVESITSQSYLITQSDTVNVLPEQWGTHFPNIIPPALKDSFFQLMDWYEDYADEEKSIKPHFDENTQYPNYYLVIEGVKSFFFPTLFIDDMPTRCLYTGETYEKVEEASPYFVQIEPGCNGSRDFIKKLFSRHESEIFGLWDLNPNVFIRSYHDFDTVYSHMRKFTHLQSKNDEGENKWYYFRYYDPAVFSSYIQQLSNHPERLATLFGVKDGEAIIDAYGARVENTFHTFTLNALPENTKRAKIELGEFEKRVFKQLSWEKQKQRIIATVSANLHNVDSQQMNKWLDEAYKNQLVTSKRGYVGYLMGRLVAHNSGLDYLTLWNEYQERTGYEDANLTELLLSDITHHKE